jgi:hypothetical protein
VRTENVTMLYVNEINSSVPVGYSLLINYTSKPWINPELGWFIILIWFINSALKSAILL